MTQQVFHTEADKVLMANDGLPPGCSLLHANTRGRQSGHWQQMTLEE